MVGEEQRHEPALIQPDPWGAQDHKSHTRNIPTLM